MNLSSRKRLGCFVDFAGMYNGWSRQEVAQALGREASKLIPDSGNPKLDLLMALADAMDWDPGQVAKCVWEGGLRSEPPPPSTPRSGDEIVAEAAITELEEQWHRLGKLACELQACATTGTQRAQAWHWRARASMGDGRFREALRHAQAGICEVHSADRLQTLLMRDLAQAHDALGHLIESGSIATEIIGRLGSGPHELEQREALADSFWLRGNSSRRRIDSDPGTAVQRAADASADLCAARHAYETLSRETSGIRAQAMAHRCAGALVECEAAIGIIGPEAAVQRVEETLGLVVDVEEFPAGEWLESHGWWAVFGCSIAYRGLCAAPLQRAMAVFTNKAAEIAERVDSWTLRERAFSLEYLRRERATSDAGVPAQWILEQEELRTVIGAIGRFPAFSDVGLEILASAAPLQRKASRARASASRSAGAREFSRG
ncbi:MAG: hypothetical protein FGM37_08810 [Phycisphaerales bacterium]|nr:hypothetical protein [Phycisphaerales bacterium]